jgi:hypothetical protein
MAWTKREIEESRKELRELLKGEKELYTILRHVSKSGMTQHISVLKKDWGNITWLVARACDMPMHDGAIKIGGCGMDMGFAIVYDLSQTLFDDGYRIGQRWL